MYVNENVPSRSRDREWKIVMWSLILETQSLNRCLQLVRWMQGNIIELDRKVFHIFIL